MSLDPRFLPSFAKLCAQPFDRPRSKIWDASERFICGFSEIADSFQSSEFYCVSDSSRQAHHLDLSVVRQVRPEVKHSATDSFGLRLSRSSTVTTFNRSFSFVLCGVSSFASG